MRSNNKIENLKFRIISKMTESNPQEENQIPPSNLQNPSLGDKPGKRNIQEPGLVKKKEMEIPKYPVNRNIPEPGYKMEITRHQVQRNIQEQELGDETDPFFAELKQKILKNPSDTATVQGDVKIIEDYKTFEATLQKDRARFQDERNLFEVRLQEERKNGEEDRKNREEEQEKLWNEIDNYSDLVMKLETDSIDVNRKLIFETENQKPLKARKKQIMIEIKDLRKKIQEAKDRIYKKSTFFCMKFIFFYISSQKANRKAIFAGICGALAIIFLAIGIAYDNNGVALSFATGFFANFLQNFIQIFE